MHCRMPGLCLALSCINSCINLSPANLSILRIETHFRFGCYRTPGIADQAAQNSEFSGFRWGHGRWACCRAFFTKSQKMCKRSFAQVAKAQGRTWTAARCAVRAGRSAGIGRCGRPLCHDPGASFSRSARRFLVVQSRNPSSGRPHATSSRELGRATSSVMRGAYPVPITLVEPVQRTKWPGRRGRVENVYQP